MNPVPPVPAGWAPATPIPAPKTSGARIADIVVTVLAFAALGIGCAFTLFFSLFFAMATDPCGSGTGCRENLVGWGMLAVWVGAGMGIIVAIGGTIFGAVRRKVMFCWPLIGIALAAAGFFLGLYLVDQVVPR
ncbi:hypothetical protein HUN08_11920 [Gordonia sp. X0973]|uniref:hypothetical protein n=1 Tax=Gordonia sp. X0973 TaxID=2742602 RepID=UPI000F527C11|nr:hypothetical protein [Gordonia sp. X0973]QKT07816.1 hypothetical protein HUN08_11920 [Gordonia sp. X0973]